MSHVCALFSALTLMVWWRERELALKNLAPLILRSFLPELIEEEDMRELADHDHVDKQLSDESSSSHCLCLCFCRCFPSWCLAALLAYQIGRTIVHMITARVRAVLALLLEFFRSLD